MVVVAGLGTAMVQLNASDLKTVAQLTVSVPPGKSDTLYYAFEEGDSIHFSWYERDTRPMGSFKIIAYPDAVQYSDKQKPTGSGALRVNETGVFLFVLQGDSNQHRTCELELQREPDWHEWSPFDTRVTWQEIRDTTYSVRQEKHLVRREFVPQKVLEPQHYFINSGSNALFKGGKSRTVVPIPLPKNTVEWYYEFTASRNQDEVDQMAGQFQLFSDVARLVDPSGFTTLTLSSLTAPPGGNVIDVYALDADNVEPFRHKQNFYFNLSASRENAKSGVCKIPGTSQERAFLGLRNPSRLHGIHVKVEAVAVVLEEEYEMREVRTPHVTTYQQPVAKALDK
ncbi:MAG: hypothetical protein F6K11_01205 [Leptolyngbya sp. SIO3F4]|nr:hypothetical protein [Leptolyngbya sp. SIO3F4]